MGRGGGLQLWASEFGEMGRWWFWALLGLVFLFSVNGYPEEDLVVRLPGQPEVSFRQFAGYVDVDVKAGRSLFYYFVEAEDDPDTKALTLWLNGGKSFFFLLSPEFGSPTGKIDLELRFLSTGFLCVVSVLSGTDV